MKKISKSSKILISILLVICIIAIVFIVKRINEQNSNLDGNVNSNNASIFESGNNLNNIMNTIENNTVNNTETNTITNTENIIETNVTNTIITNTETVTENTTDNNKTDTIENVSNELFSQYYKKAENIMKDMSLEEKVGQMFLVRYPDSGVINQIKKEAPGGYILFGKDFDNETKTSILNELTKNQQASKIGLIFGVDEEGGTVVRVSYQKAFRSSKFKSPQELWKQGQLPAILKDSREKSSLLKSIGLNMNLAPVVDVPSKTSAFMYDRSYGRGAQNTATYTSELIQTMNNDNMISVMKHFPGYGDNGDTHTGVVIDERPYSTFETSDFLPFESGIKAGGPCILVSHNIVKSMDKNYPASLSKNVHNILRENLNFSGVIMTDDLAMDAVKAYVENGEAAVQAVLAGNDMIISSDFVNQKQEVLKAVKNKKISEDLINKAVRRILAMKIAYGIIK